MQYIHKAIAGQAISHFKIKLIANLYELFRGHKFNNLNVDGIILISSYESNGTVFHIKRLAKHGKMTYRIAQVEFMSRLVQRKTGEKGYKTEQSQVNSITLDI